MVISSTLHEWMKINFHRKNFALRLALKRRQTWSRKWPIDKGCQILSKFNAEPGMQVRVFSKPKSVYSKHKTRQFKAVKKLRKIRTWKTRNQRSWSAEHIQEVQLCVQSLWSESRSTWPRVHGWGEEKDQRFSEPLKNKWWCQLQWFRLSEAI